ncbi:hypothetical protein HYFRA_00013877 [Hymenoscyphus fraxineus]|uniref:Uncharacterized protein n=1 Tax=Hymenoscyphus fraxineus TaxID=746836 RepID=A0A9N9LC23_9HELO|nr:hypothetical protein HYFRA_00013877 [Hymenoscyphus fraxineus]
MYTTSNGMRCFLARFATTVVWAMLAFSHSIWAKWAAKKLMTIWDTSDLNSRAEWNTWESDSEAIAKEL